MGSFQSTPQTVQDMTIREHSQHNVVSGGVMDKRPLGMNKEHIRDPDFLHQAPIEGHALVSGAREGKSLILPVVPQIQGHGEVLREWGRSDSNKNSLGIKSYYGDSTCLQPLVY